MTAEMPLVNILEFDLTSAPDVERLFPTLTAEEARDFADKMRVEFSSLFRCTWADDLRIVSTGLSSTRQLKKSPL